jgi:hypothetical protein
MEHNRKGSSDDDGRATKKAKKIDEKLVVLSTLEERLLTAGNYRFDFNGSTFPFFFKQDVPREELIGLYDILYFEDGCDEKVCMEKGGTIEISFTYNAAADDSDSDSDNTAADEEGKALIQGLMTVPNWSTNLNFKLSEIPEEDFDETTVDLYFPGDGLEVTIIGGGRDTECDDSDDSHDDFQLSGGLYIFSKSAAITNEEEEYEDSSYVSTSEANDLMRTYRGENAWLCREKGIPGKVSSRIFQFWRRAPPPVLCFHEGDLFFAIRYAPDRNGFVVARRRPL